MKKNNRNLLLQTLTATSLPKKKLSRQQKEFIVKKAENLKDRQKEAFIKIIFSYAYNNQELKKNELPYNIQQKNENTVLDLEKIPRKLGWIIWRFMDIS